MRARLIVSLASMLVAAPLLVAPAFSAGGGAAPAPSCAKGKVYDTKSKKCVPKTSAVDDDSIYETGRSLAMEGRYGEAIEVLSLAKDKTDPRILNYLGYSHRKQGRVLVGLGYYQEALRNNPEYTLVREYMGEAHLQLGDVASAKEQLSEIEKRCGKGCSEYTELAGQIDAYVKG
ncbi:tetratricopeptide repeat protein [Mesorhizobium sp. ZC-5]|uniref:tetratricopeptide repeat protein n=1 Tax=Mesorhizobium sp. ZC-5 TaxID=2986066 RepID=UPI0021E8061F|nr:tetratricopeptide repeat protein [Mesorhizobium sp. ZC-5]MCV3242985.1 tetratricopeptide repeat protein [Mesorhizobium sp. ZC-5]